MLGQSAERAVVIGIVGVNRIVGKARANELVIVGMVEARLLVFGRRRFVDPQRFHPGMADVAGIAGSGHARDDGLPFVDSGSVKLNGAPISRSQELPLLQSEMRQLIDADEQKLRALVLVDIIFVAAVAEARSRAVAPS